MSTTDAELRAKAEALKSFDWVTADELDQIPAPNLFSNEREFIAAASPDAVLALLDRVEAAEAAVERVRESVAAWDDAASIGSTPSHRLAAKVVATVKDALDGATS